MEKKVESIIFGLKQTIADQKAEIERLKQRHGVALLRNDDLDLENYELKKQVDELKEELEKAYEIERANIQAEIAEAGTSCHWCEQQTVKDTAKEILYELLDIEAKDNNYEVFFLDICEKLEKLSKKYGVEVE